LGIEIARRFQAGEINKSLTSAADLGQSAPQVRHMLVVSFSAGLSSVVAKASVLLSGVRTRLILARGTDFTDLPPAA
jgi:hypothetical protein